MHLRTFFSKCTPQAIDYLDGHINAWMQEEKPKVVMTNSAFGVTEGKGGQKEPQLFINIWYEDA